MVAAGSAMLPAAAACHCCPCAADVARCPHNCCENSKMEQASKPSTTWLAVAAAMLQVLGSSTGRSAFSITALAKRRLLIAVSSAAALDPSQASTAVAASGDSAPCARQARRHLGTKPRNSIRSGPSKVRERDTIVLHCGCTYSAVSIRAMRKRIAHHT
jgi:hypothetical protein